MPPPQGNSIGAARGVTCLHLLVGADPAALERCLAHADAGDAILFLDAAVLQLLRLRPEQCEEMRVGMYFGAPDLDAHGLAALAREMKTNVVDDSGFCELLALHGHCLTWT